MAIAKYITEREGAKLEKYMTKDEIEERFVILSPTKRRELVAKLNNEGDSIAQIQKKLSLSTNTIYVILREIRGHIPTKSSPFKKYDVSEEEIAELIEYMRENIGAWTLDDVAHGICKLCGKLPSISQTRQILIKYGYNIMDIKYGSKA